MTMSWNNTDLQKWIKNGCPDSPHVQLLNLIRNDLLYLTDSISTLVNLRSLYLSQNRLLTVPDSISILTNLQELALGENFITILPDWISTLANLRILVLNRNRLTTLPDSISVNLQTLDLSGNRLTTLPDSISTLVNLQTLYVYNNQLTTLPNSISSLVNLIALYISNNRLTIIPDSISTLTNLHTLDISNNRLTTILPCLGNLNLQEFYYSNNPIDHIPANVLRMINRTQTVQGVYTDAQSVHNSSIQKSLLDSVIRLLAIPIPKNDVTISILEDRFLSQDTKALLIEYCQDTSVHAVLNLTFSEMLVVVWNRIETLSEQRDEIKKTLNTEMQDAECKCFTGRISRLVNCLVGYDDLVVVEIADSEQIGTIIQLVRSRLGDNYTTDEHKRLVCDALTERGYTSDVISEWIEYIE